MAAVPQDYNPPATGAGGYLSSLPQQGMPVTPPSSAQPPITPKKKKRNPVFILAVIVLVACLGVLACFAVSYIQGQMKYGTLAERFNNEEKAPKNDLASMTVNWEELRAINPDTVAWVYVPGTKINYPVVRGADNEFYLKHDFYKEPGWLADFGCVFMDHRNVPNWNDDGYFIYGHNMNDGSMFNSIAGMQNQAEFDKARTVYIMSPYGNFKLRTFALIHAEADDNLVQIFFNDNASMADYGQNVLSKSLVNPGAIPTMDKLGKIFAFATCDNDASGRWVLYSYLEESTVNGVEPTAPSIGGGSGATVRSKTPLESAASANKQNQQAQ